jgi:hypothetical protein
LKPCNGLPLAAHSLFLCLQAQHRAGKPFVPDVERCARDTGLDADVVRDELLELRDLGILRMHDDDRVLYLQTCSHVCKGTLASIGANPRKPPKSYRIALRFSDRVGTLDPFGAGNNAALARNISLWMRQGLSEEAVYLMTDEFVGHFRSYCTAGCPPWKAFVAKRHEIIEIVQQRFTDQHCWNEKFEEQFSSMFGRSPHAKKTASNYA